MRTGSKELIRDINSHLILEIILREGKISRAALSKQSGLTKATVSAIVLELIEKNLVIEVGSDDTSMGRKPILLTFNASCGHVLSIDLNVDTIAAMAPERIVYVSCDPATLARDVKRFAALGYALRKAEAVDMFPRTAHVESVVLLTK